jgi:hypothetical protein
MVAGICSALSIAQVPVSVKGSLHCASCQQGLWVDGDPDGWKSSRPAVGTTLERFPVFDYREGSATLSAARP